MGIDNWLNKIHQGNALALLKQMPGRSVHCAITSPPYFQQRDYNTELQVFGGDKNCDHDWVEYVDKGVSGGTKSKKVQIKGKKNFQIVDSVKQAYCSKCGAYKGEFGRELTPDDYVANSMEIYRELYRVLRDDGVFILNIADTFLKKDIRR